MESWFLTTPVKTEAEAVQSAFYIGSIVLGSLRVISAYSGVVPSHPSETYLVWTMILSNLAISCLGLARKPEVQTWTRTFLRVTYSETLLLYFLAQANASFPAFGLSLSYASGGIFGTYHIFTSNSYPEFCFCMFKTMVLWLGVDVMQGDFKDFSHMDMGFICIATMLYFVVLASTYNTLGRMKSARVLQIIEQKHQTDALIRAIPDGMLVLGQEKGVLLNNSMSFLMEINDPDELLQELLASGDFGLKLKQVLDTCGNFNSDVLKVNSRSLEWRGSWTVWDEKPALILTCRDVTKMIELEQQALQESSAKSTLIRSVSHKLRTPINCIVNIAQDLSTQFATSEQRSLNIIFSCSKVLLHLVNDMIDNTQLMSGLLVLNKSFLNPVTLITDTIDVFSCFADAKDLYLKLLLDPELPVQVFTDPARFMQVLSNLVSNAIKYTTRGGVVVTAVITAEEKLRISVSDTGAGVVSDRLETINKIFREEYYPKLPYGECMGLYLSNCMSVLLGGSAIVLQSLEGSGSTFSFEIDITNYSKSLQGEDLWEVPEEDQTDFCEVTTNMSTLPTFSTNCFLQNPSLSRSDILIVDDTPFNRMVLRTILERDGYAVEEAKDGQEAVDLLCSPRALKRAYRLIIMDLDMPVLDGISATLILKRLEATHAIRLPPIIGHSAFTSETDLQSCFSAGMVAFLPKPCDRVVALSLIREHILSL